MTYLPYRYQTTEITEAHLAEMKEFQVKVQAELEIAVKKAAKANALADALRNVVTLTGRDIDHIKFVLAPPVFDRDELSR